MVVFQDSMAKVGDRVLFRTVTVLTVMLPLFGFIVCVAWSLIFDFKSSTATHCGVSNCQFLLLSTVFSSLCFVHRCTITCHQYQLQLGTISLKDIFGDLL